MNKLKYLLIGAFLLAFSFLTAQTRDIQYIQKYALLAVEEMEIYKIPASITLAQGILETGGGQSHLALHGNNHFGIKCKSEWTGGKIYHDDDQLGECFRKYDDVKGSFRDHSKFLTERPYYKDLFNLDPTDYKAWAHGLKKAGYATNPRYAYILINKIEKLQLDKFDKLTSNKVYDQVVSLYGPVDRNIVEPDYKKPVKEKVKIAKRKPKIESNKPTDSNSSKSAIAYKNKLSPKERLFKHKNYRDYIIIQPGETIHKISKMYDVSEKDLLKFNELKSPSDLKAGQFLFFKKKRNWAKSRYHTVKKGETMYLISQRYAMKLDKLYYKNRMKRGQEPNVGDVLYLRGRKPNK